MAGKLIRWQKGQKFNLKRVYLLHQTGNNSDFQYIEKINFGEKEFF